MTTPLDVLGQAHYVLLTTFKKDGTPVPTPVWVVRHGDELRVWTAPNAGKVKRIRRSAKVQIAPCSFRGKPRGASVDAVARLLAPSDAEAVLDALGQKYGLRGRLGNWRARRGGRPSAAIGITVVS
ncbi:MAG TPA: PPOX class F420-dependent oxidoreductase [Nakamurella sp.]|nr:PPOX class F420-dependent oxidoreductase [Nakamurella sp.]